MLFLTKMCVCVSVSHTLFFTSYLALLLLRFHIRICSMCFRSVLVGQWVGRSFVLSIDLYISAKHSVWLYINSFAYTMYHKQSVCIILIAKLIKTQFRLFWWLNILTWYGSYSCFFSPDKLLYFPYFFLHFFLIVRFLRRLIIFTVSDNSPHGLLVVFFLGSSCGNFLHRILCMLLFFSWLALSCPYNSEAFVVMMSNYNNLYVYEEKLAIQITLSTEH